MNNHQKGGARGAQYGILIERLFASRSNGQLSTLQKTDVMDGQLHGHSIKNTRRCPNSRLEARSYSNIDKLPFPDLFHDWKLVRQEKSNQDEKTVCENIVRILNQDRNTHQLLTHILTNHESGLDRFTVYDNRTEIQPEDQSGQFRCFDMKHVLQFLSDHITWKTVKSTKYYNIHGFLKGFTPISMSIGHGSPRRQLILFDLRNTQKQLDFWVSQGLQPIDII